MYLAETERDPEYRIAEGAIDCAQLLQRIAEVSRNGSSAVAVVMIDDTGDNYHTYQFGCDAKKMRMMAIAISEYHNWMSDRENEV